MNIFNKILENKEKSFFKEQKEKNEEDFKTQDKFDEIADVEKMNMIRNSNEPKVCPACNQEPCTCVSECESCGA